MRIFVVAAFAALALSACQDPAGVGLGLIDEEQSDPSARIVPLGDLDTLTYAVPAIGIADASTDNARPQGRVLVGEVVDAQFGDARSIGYIDAFRPSSLTLPDADEILEAWVAMPRTYTYGDTTAALPVTIHDIQGSWTASDSYPADTMFAVGPALSATSVAQADSLVRFDLPASWVSSNAATLIADDFSESFEGFALQAQSGFAPASGVVFGFGTFSAVGVGLRIRTAEDTLTFPLSEVFSSIAGQTPTAPPADVIPLRRGTGSELRFTADLSAFGPIPLARGMLRLPLESSLAQQGTFVRPIAERSALFGVRDSDTGSPTYVVLGIVTASDDFGVLVDTRSLTSALQRLLINPETQGYDRFEIRPDINPEFNPASLDILPVLRPATGEPNVPRITLTVVGAPA